jgi:predicted  nucleic acid-binding Zn-ribbon protein
MQEVLQQLANLQYIDSRIDEIRQLRGDLPEEVLDIETNINRYEAKIGRLEEELDSLTAEKKKLEVDMETSHDKTKKYEEQQLTVRNNREYDALTKEIEAQKQFVENAISRIEEIGKRVEEVEAELEEKREKLEDTKSLHEDKKENLDKVIGNTRTEEDKLLEKREELEEELDKRYTRSYKRLRNGLTNGIAVVAMEKGAALGMALPPQTQVEVRRKNKIIIDENSGRIVVDPSFFEEAKKQLQL